MYDLHSLGWHSFQQLCLTIAREILGQTVEAFLDTGDGGRDGAFTGVWAPLRSRGPLPGEGPSAEESASADLSGPTLVMILQRLGLKLESQRAPVESFVIEHVERPTEN